jgi:FMN reductase
MTTLPSWRIVAVHAGRGPDSVTRALAVRILETVRGAAADRAATGIVDVWRLLPSMHDALTVGVWDEALRQARAAIATADAVVAVTPIIHGGYSGSFKSFVDLVGVSGWTAKPVAVGACGGTLRHSLAVEHVVRPLFVCLRAVPLPTAVYATSTECAAGRVAGALRARIERVAGEVLAAAAAAPIRPVSVAAVHGA